MRILRRGVLRSASAALAVLLVHVAPAAAADPCRQKPTAPQGEPHRFFLETFGVLRRPATASDRLPRSLRDSDGKPFPAFAQRVELPTGGHLWVLPLSDVTDRVIPSEACIRTLPRRWRAEIRAQKRRDLRRRAVQGMTIRPFGADGESRGGAVRSPVLDVVGSGLFHWDGGVDQDKSNVIVGLVPDHVVRVRVTLPAFTDERRRKQPRREAVVDVRDNVFAAELASPFDFETPEGAIAWLDASGAVVGPADQR